MTPDAGLTMAAPLLKALAAPTVAAVGNALGWTVDKVKLTLSLTFNDHFEAAKRKCSYVRTINNPDRNTPISDIYVNLYLTTGKVRLRDEDLLRHLDVTGKFIITGTAGAGKSMIMRKLLLQAMDQDYPLIPFFVDLRDVTNLQDNTLIDQIFSLTTPETQRGNKGLFLQILDKTGVCFFLDGLDEVDPEWRNALRQAIEDVLVRFPKLKVILSSRPDVDFGGWEEFETIKIQKLQIDQSISIIEKAEFFDEAIRAEFLEKLKSGAFADHSSFLEIAMLNVILLMCYGEYLELSEKFSSFYDQAYEVLYRRHDRVKGLRRRHYAQLPADDFKRIVTAFCYRTYVDYSLSFTEGKLTEYLEKAVKIAGVTADSGALAQDMTESVSLLQRDGTKIFFIHRSFQEYFAARFMVEYRGEETFKVFDVILRKHQAIKIASIAFELNKEQIEKAWVLPFLNKIIEICSDRDGPDDLSPLAKLYLEIDVQKNVDGNVEFNGYSFTPAHLTSQLRVLDNLYHVEEISDGFIVEHRPVAIDGEDIEIYLKRFGRTLEDDLEVGEESESQNTITYQIQTEGPHPDWLVKTDIPDRLSALTAALCRLRSEVAKRVDDRASESVFA